MFGKMNVVPIINLGVAHEKGGSLDKAVERLLALAEYPAIAKWVQFPKALLLFLVVPEDSESGAFYVYDRCSRVWSWIDFEDENFGGYNIGALYPQHWRDTHLRVCGPEAARLGQDFIDFWNRNLENEQRIPWSLRRGLEPRLLHRFNDARKGLLHMRGLSGLMV